MKFSFILLATVVAIISVVFYWFRKPYSLQNDLEKARKHHLLSSFSTANIAFPFLEYAIDLFRGCSFTKSNSICYFKIIFPKKFIMISHFGNKKFKKYMFFFLVVHCNINKSIGIKHTEILHGCYFWVVGSIPISYFSYFNSIFFPFLQQTYFILYQARVLEWVAIAFSDSFN